MYNETDTWKGAPVRQKRAKQVYYEVFALQDGTILLAAPTRKPVKNALNPRARSDEDGIHQWFIQQHKDYERLPQWTGGGTPFYTLANYLNVKRLLRSQVEAKLNAIGGQMAELKAQFDRIEAALGGPNRG
jgi:hypothetical protein